VYATHNNTLQHTLQHTLQRTATHCNTLQHTATHCNTQQHTDSKCCASHSPDSSPSYCYMCVCVSVGVCARMHLCMNTYLHVYVTRLNPNISTATHCNALPYTETDEKHWSSYVGNKQVHTNDLYTFLNHLHVQLRWNLTNRTQTCTHIHTHAHTHTHTRTHTHTHTRARVHAQHTILHILQQELFYGRWKEQQVQWDREDALLMGNELQRAAVCCREILRVAVCCRCSGTAKMPCLWVMRCSVLQCVAGKYYVLQCVTAAVGLRRCLAYE